MNESATALVVDGNKIVISNLWLVVHNFLTSLETP